MEQQRVGLQVTMNYITSSQDTLKELVRMKTRPPHHGKANTHHFVSLIRNESPSVPGSGLLMAGDWLWKSKVIMDGSMQIPTVSFTFIAEQATRSD